MSGDDCDEDYPPYCLGPRDWKLAASEFGDAAARVAQFDRGEVIAVVAWDWDTGEGEVCLHPRVFDGMCPVAVMDALKDAIGLLEREYAKWSCVSGREMP